MRHARDVKYRKLPFERIKARMIAKRPLGAKLPELYVSFQQDFGVRRNFEIHRLAAHQFDGIAPQKPREEEFVKIGRDGKNACQTRRGVGTNGYGDFELSVRM